MLLRDKRDRIDELTAFYTDQYMLNDSAIRRSERFSYGDQQGCAARGRLHDPHVDDLCSLISNPGEEVIMKKLIATTFMAGAGVALMSSAQATPVYRSLVWRSMSADTR